MTTVQNIVGSRRFVLALVAAAAVFTVMLVQRVVGFGSNVVLAFWSDPANSWMAALPYVLLGAIPFSLGVLIAFWLAPIAAHLTIARVLGHSTVAAGAGAVLSAIIGAIIDLLGSLRLDGSLFGNSFPGIRSDRPWTIEGFLWAVQGALQSFLSLAPLVLLVGVLLWIWLRHRRPEEAASATRNSV